jgi:hypothetical protein
MNYPTETTTTRNSGVVPLILTLAFFTLGVAVLGASARAETAPEDGTEQVCPAGADGAEACPCAHGGIHAMHHGVASGDGAGPDGMQFFDRMGEKLSLSDDQKQQLLALLEMYRPRIQELLERGDVAGRDLMAMAPDDPKYGARSAELSQLASLSAAEMVILMSELQANAYALLSTEQKARYMELRAEQQARMEQKKAEMEERHKSRDATGMRPGMGMSKTYQCKACEWLEQDDARQAAEKPVS